MSADSVTSSVSADSNPQRIALIVGGASAEASVSRVSGAAVAEALSNSFPALTVFELDAELTRNLQHFKPDVVVPVLHGPPGEDGTIQGYLETLGYPYVGSGVTASACAMNKIIAKQLFHLASLPLVKDMILHQNEVQSADDYQIIIERIQRRLGERIVIKPASQGSALGIARVHTQDAQDALQQAFEYDKTLLLEQRIDGREITVGVLQKEGGSEFEALPVIEVTVPEKTWYDYDHRYAADGAKHLIPAPLPARLTKSLQNTAIEAHKVLGCRDLSRADFIVTAAGQFHLLEVNTLPGMTATSLYPDAARVAGYNLTELMLLLIHQAWHRR